MVAIGGASCMGLFLCLIGCWTCYIGRSIRKRRHRRRQMREDAHRAHGDEAATMFSQYDEKRTRMLAASRLSAFRRSSAAPSVPTSKTSTTRPAKAPAKAAKPSPESSGQMLRPTTALPATSLARPSTTAPAPKDVKPPPASKIAATKWMSATEPKQSKGGSTFAIQSPKNASKVGSTVANKQLASAPITLPSAKTLTNRTNK
uniref:Uncharacterized protein n=1 Tax=Romanomermis culicivorax TaxID=13658 RepID=A0A915KEW2_ROMCU